MNPACNLVTFGINGSLRKREVHSQVQPQPQVHTEYYLFNSAANLKAYSNNGLDFAYYGYNASNTRAYKLSMLNMHQWVNGQPEPLDLQLQSAMFYPNAYINFNQNGEYTKHYYNGTERIASRLGSNTHPTDATSNDRLEYRMMREEEKFRENIQELVSDGQPVDLQGTVDINSLQPVNATSNIFYYHTNHLGSTAFVTDQNRNVTQGFLYAPFGEITTEYNSNFGSDIIPKYSFNAKELDEETGMYYYEARYYKPPVFTSRDPMFEKYPTFSPYTYCANNPVKYVDPDGRKIKIRYLDGQGNTQEVYYYKGKLYTDRKHRTLYQGGCGKENFAELVCKDLSNIESKGGKLASRLGYLSKSIGIHTIESKDNNYCHVIDPQEGMCSNTMIGYNRNTDDIEDARAYLVHELLGHAYSADQGTYSENRKKMLGTSNQEQINAIDIENVYRKAVSLPLRTEDENADGDKYDVSKYLDLNAVNQ